MAERRMFAKTIIDSDAFLDMPLSTQALYFHLSMRADDDGFINNPRKIQRMIGANDDDFKLLIAKRFIILFDSGVIAIKHWKIHNYIQKDRYKETVYKDEKSMLTLKENNAYTVMDAPCIQDGYSSDTQCRLGKVSLGKSSIGKCSVVIDSKDDIDENPNKDPDEEKHPHHTHISLSVYKNLCSKYGKAFVDSKVDKAYNDKALIKFCEQDYNRKQSSGANKNKFNKFEQRDYDLNALEERLTSIPPPTAGNNETIRKNAEELQERLKGEQ